MWLSKKQKEEEGLVLPMVLTFQLDEGGQTMELIQLETSTDERIINEFQHLSLEIEQELQATSTQKILIAFYFSLTISFIICRRSI